jgi:hypothetical protein
VAVAAGLALGASAQGALDARFVADFAPNMFGSTQYTAWELSMIQVSLGVAPATAVALSPADFNNHNGTWGNDVAMTIATDANTGHIDQFSDRGGRTFFGTVITDDAGGKVVISKYQSRPIVEMSFANDQGQTTTTYKSASLIAYNADGNGGWTEIYRGSAQNATFSADLVIAYAVDDTVTPAPVAGIANASQFNNALNNRQGLEYVGGRLFLKAADLNAGKAFGDGWQVGFGAVPAPGAMALLGLSGLAVTRRRR